MTRFIRPLTCMLALLLLCAVPALAAKSVNKTFLGGLAVEGYDVVAYFNAGKPTKGSKSHTYSWQGATWRFASAENRELFVASPEKYAPQYGGYCAYAMAQGKTVGIDPDAWKIIDGKLYLNYNQKIQKKWQEDAAGFIAKADREWPKLLED